MSDDQPMTPEQIAWVREARTTENDGEPCRHPRADLGTCAFASSDGVYACGLRCLWNGAK